MKYLFFILLSLLAINTSAQYFINDSIHWKLSTNDSANYKGGPFGVKGANQKTAAGINAPTYIDGFQKISRPANGWPVVIEVLNNNSYVDFPFGFSPDICFDTTNGYRYCLGYSFFNLKLLKVTAFGLQTNQPTAMDVYFYDTSCYASREGTNYKYLGELSVSSTSPQEPNKIQLIVPETNNGTPYACGAGGRYSSVRLYPKSGGDIFLKDVIIAGSSGALLPINFKYIKAFSRGGFVEVNWQIDNVQDLQNFVIQKSVDGRNFKDAEIIKGSGFLSGSRDYSWNDKTPGTSNNFYRIKAIEQSGKAILSRVVKVTNSKQAGPNIYPNPVANKSLNISMNKMSFGKYQVALINQTGQTIFSAAIIYKGERQKQLLLPDNISPGTYTIKVLNPEYSWYSKVIIL